MSKQTKIYFPSLNGLRFIAAFAVVVHHLEQVKLFFNVPSLFYQWHFVKIMGELGVTLFFTLSGFLITYLLLAEKEKFGTIAVKQFYVRRVLRIWPLYYLIIILGLFVLPHINFFHIDKLTEGVHYKFGVKTVFYFLLLPNVISNLYTYMPYIAQTWSIGIEEQFYLVWPWIVKYTKNYLKVLWAIVTCLMVITGTLFFFADHSEDISKAPNSIKLVTFFYKFFHMLRIGCMAIGGIGAYYLYKLDMRVLRIVFSNYTQLVTYVIIIEMLLFGVEIPYINHEVYSILFLIIILNLAANPNTLVNLENKMMDYMGKISYSIYMWHNIAIIIGLKIAQVYNPKLDGFFSNALYYISTFIITFILSAASYEFFEMRFLKYKNLFTKIQSGNLTPNDDSTEGDKTVVKESAAPKKIAISKTVLP